MKGMIIGFGNMGQNHYERYKQINEHDIKINVEIIIVIDTDAEKRRIANEFGLKTYATLKECLHSNNLADINFLDICVPTDLHLSFIQQTIEQFKDHPIPMIVEKPIVRTSEEVDELRELAKTYSCPIFVAEVEHYNTRITNFFNTLDNPSHIKISRMVNKDYFLKSTNQWSLSDRSGGPILDLMIHDFSVLDRFGEAKLIAGKFKTKVKYEGVNEATVTLKYPSLIAEVTGSWLSTHPNPIILTIDAIEENGLIKQLLIDDYAIRGSHYDPEDPFYLEIKTFLESINTQQQTHQLEEYLRAVNLANNIITLAKQQTVPYEPMHFKPVENNEGAIFSKAELNNEGIRFLKYG